MSVDGSEFFKEKRPWSVVKDKLLESYLIPYFQKMLTSYRPTLYVDCFAGKGKFDDGREGSPIIAINAREICLKRASGSIETCFIEKNFAKDLTECLERISYSFGKPMVISGSYEDTICDCLKNKVSYNVFLYIDPYGYTPLKFSLYDKFQNYELSSLEMLINFSSLGFFRNACRVMKVKIREDLKAENTDEKNFSKSEDSLNQVAGGDYWKAIIADYGAKIISAYEAESRLTAQYKVQLRKYFKYVMDLPISDGVEHIPKYRLIYVTNHPDGGYIMAGNMFKRFDELYKNVQMKITGQITIFDGKSEYSHSLDGTWYSDAEINSMIRCHIFEYKRNVDFRLQEFLLSFVTQYGIICNFRTITKILQEMETQGEIAITRFPSETVKKRESKFWTETNNHKIFIKVV